MKGVRRTDDEQISHEELRRIIYYDPETGRFSRLVAWKKAPLGPFTGTLANGYLVTGIQYKLYRMNRLAWFWMTGKWGDHIDHANLDRADNRWCNLRDCNAEQSQGNKPKHKNNTTGYKGVTFDKRRNKFMAQMSKKASANKNGGPVHIFLGYFDTAEAAHAAYVTAAVERWGEFARAE